MAHPWATLRPTLVASDIDGTIVPVGGTVSERTRAALHACRAAGVEVVLVTGRPPRWLPPVIEATGLTGTVIASNGAITVDAPSLRVLDVTPIPRDKAVATVAALSAAIPEVVFAAENATELRMGPGYSTARASTARSAEGLLPTRRSAVETRSVEDMLDAPDIFKLVAVAPRSNPDAALAVARREVTHLVTATRSASGIALIEMGPLGVTKATALAAHAARLGRSAGDVVAFGDMPNDVDMLRWAGRGYAMAGAHPEAVAATAFTAPSAAEDGVAQVLEDILAARDAS